VCDELSERTLRDPTQLGRPPAVGAVAFCLLGAVAFRGLRRRLTTCGQSHSAGLPAGAIGGRQRVSPLGAPARRRAATCAEHWGHRHNGRVTESEDLERLETSLWRTESRFDREYMESLLAPDFFEFGRSGRTYTRDETLAIRPEQIDARLSDFRIVPIGNDARLVTYVSDVGDERANRSSLWVRSGSTWTLKFHQGTPTSRGAGEPLRLDADLGDGAALRPLAATDVRDLHDLIAANRAHLRPWLPWADQDEPTTAAFVHRAIAAAARREGLHLAIVANGSIAGVCGFHAISWAHGSASVGYWIAEAAQGRGTVTRAVRALVDHAFTDLGLHRVELRTAPDNLRSRAVATRVGFTQEGTLREGERFGDRFADSVVYSVLAPEWR
jgi:ribosomal-protein-serine acetyltransferase